MPRSKLLFGLFFLISVSAAAQTLFTHSLEGKVMHNEVGVADVHVLNLTANKAVITNEDGQFSIPVSLNDTLLFSAVQYKRKSLVVTPGILASSAVFVPLEEFVNELDEVVVRPYDLSGDLDRDMRQLQTEQVVAASTLGLPNAYVKPPTMAERKLFEATTGGGIIPMNPVINAITGRTKYLKKVLATERQYARTERVRDFYADSLFVKQLKIPGQKIDDFMYFCEVDTLFNSLVDTHDRLKIWEFLKEKSEEYRTNNNLDK